MTPRTTRGPRRKPRVDSSSHDSTGTNDAATGSPDGGAARDVHMRIAALAYEIYEQRGRQDGYDLEDWLTAEQRVLVGRNSQTTEEKRPSGTTQTTAEGGFDYVT